MNEDKFPNNRKPSHQRLYREFWKLRGQQTWDETHTHTHTHTHTQTHTENMHLTTTPSGEVAQRLASATNEWGLNREAWVTHLK